MTRLRARRAYFDQLTIAIAMTAFFILAPIIPATAMARTIPGKEIIISESLMITMSTHPPKYPASVPKIVPATKIIATNVSVAGREILDA